MHDDEHAPSAKHEPTAPPIDPLEVRSNPRVGTDLPVELYASDFSGALLGRTRDLSIGGACLATQSPFSIKGLHTVVLKLPDRDLRLDVDGCWQHDENADRSVMTGVSFRHPDREVLDVIWDHVLDAGKRLARFLYERTALHELGLEEAMGLAQVTRYHNVSAGDPIYQQGERGVGTDSIFMIADGVVSLQVRVTAQPDHGDFRSAPAKNDAPAPKAVKLCMTSVLR